MGRGLFVLGREVQAGVFGRFIGVAVMLRFVWGGVVCMLGVDVLGLVLPVGVFELDGVPVLGVLGGDPWLLIFSEISTCTPSSFWNISMIVSCVWPNVMSLENATTTALRVLINCFLVIGVSKFWCDFWSTLKLFAGSEIV